MSFHSDPFLRKSRITLDDCAVLAAIVFVVLVIAGVLPRVPW